MSQKLGKAKRLQQERQARSGQITTATDAATHQQVAARHAGMTYTEALQYSLRAQVRIAQTSPPVLNVPCNTCNACCYNHRIEVDRSQEPPERLARLDMVPDEYGDMKLRKRADGSCVHLGENGCTIYEHRPTTCRTYDCRMSCMLGIRRAYQHGDAVIEEPAWIFDQETRKDRILHAAFQMAGDHLRQTGFPEDPDDLNTLLASIAPAYIAKSREMADQCDDLFASMRHKNGRSTSG
jgi:Fe-S-cluster containining protein